MATMTTGRKTYSFTVILAGVSELTVEMADALFAAGCDDATPASCAGVVSVDFDRQSESLGQAICSAVADVERAGYQIARVEVDEPMA